MTKIIKTKFSVISYSSKGNAEVAETPSRDSFSVTYFSFKNFKIWINHRVHTLEY